MPLERIDILMKNAASTGYAVGYFESWSIDSLQGVIDAAEQTRSPVIIGFNGEFLSGAGRRAQERLEWYATLGKAAAESAAVPCGFIFNECPNDAWVRRASECGFNLVMLADAEAPYDQYVRRVAAIAQHAHKHGAAVEAELGRLPCGNGAHDDAHASATDPQRAAEFVAQTGIDLLAISVGNVHIKLEGQQDLDLSQLAALRERVRVPFVLHGGSGITADSLREAIAMGVTKVNYGTYIKQRYLRAVRDKLRADVPDPHRTLGIGGDEDVLVAGRFAVRDAVLERIENLGCCGKAGAA